MAAQANAARRAYVALRKGEDPEALHDLRVALRRMRSLLRAYRGELRLRKRFRRELSDLASATNPARDAEVLLDLFSRLPLPKATAAKTGVAWAGARLHEGMQAGARAARVALDADLERLCRHVEGGLEIRTTGLRASWRTVLAEQLEAAWAELDVELRGLQAAFCMDRAHRARIDAKRLRYLLEPARAALEPARALVEESKRLQSLLGDLHDAQVFGEWLTEAAQAAGAHRGRAELARSLGEEPGGTGEAADALPGLVYLGKMVREREQALEDEAKAWLAGDGLQRLGDAVQAVHDAL